MFGLRIYVVQIKICQTSFRNSKTINAYQLFDREIKRYIQRKFFPENPKRQNGLLFRKEGQLEF
ncbi:hypothetical protein AKJ39_00880 [candidate division MSBL1 archaeon SCGC-AAA259J03]|uniref:Uncharacterized protein n=1 Tax=candidate division MSBL1 archaeon SCGC-AAA259J03 TaxID=1698269 RepID=A0A656YX18_9EURY|nr:hypothetical protein AKJ39_00880 [candidate division MSBL1 archaeon SCGC-AAA259J03]